MKNIVHLVGAGPGDPGLITKRGLDLLRRADALVVDALVNPILLRENPTAEIYDAGKRGGSKHAMPQEKINALLVRLAKQGKRVVRLKGGDPFVFGRGGEEVEALKKAGVLYEVVPGVTSAIAAPAYSGIPISDRRWSSQVTFFTGHEGKPSEDGSSGVDWSSLSPSGTLVVLMGVAEWPSIRRNLRGRGWPANTPVAAVMSGTTKKSARDCDRAGKVGTRL
jgi:uroporphyrinogen III methyltransferase/synthase